MALPDREYGREPAQKQKKVGRGRRWLMFSPVALLLITFVIWLSGSSNPITPAGYEGYLVQRAVFGEAKFVGLQKGPVSPGRTWMIDVVNVSITPYTYTEPFDAKEKESVLSKDNLQVSFRVHVVWRVAEDRVQQFVESYSGLENGDSPDKVVQIAYDNFLKEPLRTSARDKIQRLKALEIKDKMPEIGEQILKEVQHMTADTPFEVTSIVVGNIQYPDEVANSVASKMAKTQVLEQRQTEIEISKADKQMRIIEAEGIAKSMEIINQKLTSLYVQHEAVEAQKAMVGSPNHTVMYVPVGPMGIPLVKTLDEPSNPPSGK